MSTMSTQATPKTTSKISSPEKNKTADKSLYRKILEVQRNIQPVGKNGYNAFQKYAYMTESDLLEALKAPMAEQGLIAIPTITAQETGFRPDGKSWAKVVISFKVIDVESGDEIESITTGYAEDVSDKAIYKAITGATKYFYMKFFGVPSDDDPENEKGVGHGQTVPMVSRNVPKQVSRQIPPQPSSEKDNDKALQARILANMILDLQNKYHLSNQEVLSYGGIDSLKGAVERGDVDLLEKAHFKIAEAARKGDASSDRGA